MQSQIDHLVVVARTLALGVQWCEATIGVTPGPDATEPRRLHPRNSLPRSGVSLRTLAVTHPDAAALQVAYASIGLAGVSVEAGPADIVATLHTPRGTVQLHSGGA